MAATNRMVDTFQPLIDARQAGVGDELLSLLWREGPSVADPWGDTEVRANLRGIVFGASDTTSLAISNAPYLLVTDQRLQDRVRNGDRRTPSAFVEESLRLYGSIHYRPRRVIQPFDLAGHHFDPGDQADANRDPEHFSCPNDVVLDRKALRDHFAFAFGPWTCVGAALARANIEEVISTLLTTFRSVALEPEQPPPALSSSNCRPEHRAAPQRRSSLSFAVVPLARVRYHPAGRLGGHVSRRIAEDHC